MATFRKNDKTDQCRPPSSVDAPRTPGQAESDPVPDSETGAPGRNPGGNPDNPGDDPGVRQPGRQPDVVADDDPTLPGGQSGENTQGGRR
jgi:hypothetical protein